jgi:hypothetical protein
MSIAFTCTCGKPFNVADQLAGRTLKCPACHKPVAVPDPAATDFETVEDEPVTVDCEVVAEGGSPGSDPTRPKKRKKKKGPKSDRATPDPELEPEEYQRWLRETSRRQTALFRGSAFLGLGLIIVGGAVYIWVRHRQDMNPLHILLIGLVGVLAVGKGAFGLLTGQFVGEDD